jgi:hypothetical protein
VYLGEDAGASKTKEAILEDHHKLLLSVKGRYSTTIHRFRLVSPRFDLTFSVEEDLIHKT